MLITSRDNDKIKRIRSLHDHKWRKRTGFYYIEGMRLVAEALEVGVDIEQIVICRDAIDECRRSVIDRVLDIGRSQVLEVSREVFKSISIRDDSDCLAAVARQRWEKLDDITPGSGLCWVAVNAVRYPGNLGTIFRLSDSVGGTGVILLGDSTDPYDPAVVRASLGAVFSQRIVRAGTIDLAEWKEKHGICIVGTSPAALQDYRSVKYPSPVVLFLGNENTGLTDEQFSLCDITVSIPMAGRIESHNVAAAAGIVLYEMYNQGRTM